MKKLYIFLFTVVSILMLTVFVSAVDINVVADDQRQFASVEDAYYLPSYISPSCVKLTHDGTSVEYENAQGQNVSLPSGTVLDLRPFKQVTPAGNEAYVLNLRVNGKYRMLVFYFASDLPSVHIQTSVGESYLTANNAKDKEVFITVIMVLFV